MKPICVTMLSLLLAVQLVGCTGAATAPNTESGVTAPAAEAPLVARPVSTAPSDSIVETTEETDMLSITLQVGEQNFSATLVNSEATQAFVKYLPMTVQMADLNGQEKFYGLPENLPANSTERPDTIYSGDIFCWSGNTLVLFYATFQNSYGGYVRLGTVDDPAGLAKALGGGSAEVTWSLAK